MLIFCTIDVRQYPMLKVIPNNTRMRMRGRIYKIHDLGILGVDLIDAELSFD